MREVTLYCQGYCASRAQAAIDKGAVCSGPHYARNWCSINTLTAKIIQLKLSDFPENLPLFLEMKRLCRKSFLGFGLSKVLELHVKGSTRDVQARDHLSQQRENPLCFVVGSITPRKAPHFSCQINRGVLLPLYRGG